MTSYGLTYSVRDPVFCSSDGIFRFFHQREKMGMVIAGRKVLTHGFNSRKNTIEIGKSRFSGRNSSAEQRGKGRESRSFFRAPLFRRVFSFFFSGKPHARIRSLLSLLFSLTRFFPRAPIIVVRVRFGDALSMLGVRQPRRFPLRDVAVFPGLEAIVMKRTMIFTFFP